MNFRFKLDNYNYDIDLVEMVGSDYHEDAATRDFTMNTIYFDLATRTLVDPFQGAEDIQKRLIRAVGDDCETVFRDSVRAIRALRLACCLNFELSPEISSHIKQLEKKEIYHNLSCGKFEFQKICQSDLLFEFLAKLIDFELIWHYPFSINFFEFNHSKYVRRVLSIATKYPQFKQKFYQNECFTENFKIYLVFIYLTSHWSFKP